ncbi:hypothetical protein ABZ956_29520, partial [Streptomyces sp. NPDC046261]
FGPGGPPWQPGPKPPGGSGRRVVLAVTALVAVAALALGAVLVVGDRSDSGPGKERSPGGPGAASPSFRLPSELPSWLPSGLPSGFPSQLPTSLPGLPTALPTDILGL